jgi:1,2-phenylacetyl-CoA epoxidase catalytic subunit
MVPTEDEAMAKLVTHKEEMDETYRGMVVRLMTRQFLAEMATCEVFGRCIELAPNWRERAQIARFAAEEGEHAESAALLLEQLGVSVDDLLRRRPRALDFFGVAGDLEEWVDAVAFNFVVDRAGTYQLMTYRGNSYAPWAETMTKILKEEAGHQSHGVRELGRLCEDPAARARAQSYVNRILPETMKRAFGRPDPEANDYCLRTGLKTRATGEIQRAYVDEMTRLSLQCGLSMPDLPASGVVLG